MMHRRPASQLVDDAPYHVPALLAPIDLHLEGNEGPLSPPDWGTALAPYGPDVVRRYQNASDLEELLADHLKLAAAQVLVTAGADDALDRVFRALLPRGGEVLLTTPTFDMIERFARLAGGRLISVPWLDGEFPIQAMVDRITPETGVIAVVTPNNPTGLTVSMEDLGRLSEAAPQSVLLVDMAYGEFAEEDPTALVTSLSNAIMVRTFSKAWGFAGLRVGYAAGPASLIAALRVAGPPYPVSGPSLAMVTHRFMYEREAVENVIVQVSKERAELRHLLTTLGAHPWPSQANFVLARFDRAEWVWRGLAGLGIAVRAFPGRPGLSAALRITCPGEATWFERLTSGLRAVMQPEALLFDMDGVLADVSQSYRKAIVDTAAHFKVVLTPADISTAKAQGSANNDWDLTWRLVTAAGGRATLAEITETFERLYQGSPECPGLWTREQFLGERSALERLATRLPLGVVTGRPRQDAVRFLEEHGISNLFKTVVCMEDGPLKPAPAPVQRALKNLGVANAWLVGDTPDDLVAARRAGVVPLGIPAPGEDGTHASQVLLRAGAAVVLEHLSDLSRLLP